MQIAQGRAADSTDAESLRDNTDLAWAYLLNREYAKAVEQSLSMPHVKFNFPLAHLYLGQVYLCMKRYGEAIEEIEKALPSDEEAPAPTLAMLGHAYGLAGNEGAARRILRRIEKLSKRCTVSSYDWAVLHSGLGHRDEAIRHLTQALEERVPRVIWLKVEPAFDSLRGDRRFEELVLRLRLD